MSAAVGSHRRPREKGGLMVGARHVAVSVTVAALLVVSGCRAPASHEGRPPDAAGPLTAPLEEMERPALTYQEWRLPEGAMLEDHAERFAALIDNNFDGVGSRRIRLLDMRTGIHRVVVPDSIGRAQGFLTLGLQCSDTWVVWEEMKGDEVERPLEVEWRLWAAAIDTSTVEVSEPVEVARSVVSAHTRPLFDVVGDTLYYMTNTFPNSRQEGAVFRSRIVAVSLPSSASREVYSSKHMIHSFSVADDALVVTEYLDSDSERCRVRVVGIEDGEERFSYDLGNDRRISHWPSYVDGTLFWAEEVSADAPWPTLWCRTPDGQVRRVAERALDTAVAGPYVFFRAYVRNAGRAEKPTVRGVELATMRTFELVSSERPEDGYWQPMLGAHAHDHAFVTWMLRYGSTATGEKGETVVRRYEVP